METQRTVNGEEREKVISRLHELLDLQNKIMQQFGEKDYNIFIFGSYLTTRYIEGKSDIDIAIYTEDFGLYKRLSLYLEEYYNHKGIANDIFYIDTKVEAPIFCSPLKSKVQFTDYYPEKLTHFRRACEKKLEETKTRLAG